MKEYIKGYIEVDDSPQAGDILYHEKSQTIDVTLITADDEELIDKEFYCFRDNCGLIHLRPISSTIKPKLNIELKYSTWECGDGCCSGHNYECILNGESLGLYSDEPQCLEAVLEHLGYEVESELTYEYY